MSRAFILICFAAMLAIVECSCGGEASAPPAVFQLLERPYRTALWRSLTVKRSRPLMALPLLPGFSVRAPCLTT
jgi:hypothetical protein